MIPIVLTLLILGGGALLLRYSDPITHWCCVGMLMVIMGGLVGPLLLGCRACVGRSEGHDIVADHDVVGSYLSIVDGREDIALSQLSRKVLEERIEKVNDRIVSAKFWNDWWSFDWWIVDELTVLEPLQ